MLLPGTGLALGRELLRRVEGLAGEVPMRWAVEPRFGYRAWRTRIGRRLGVPVAAAGSDALAAPGTPAIRGFEQTVSAALQGTRGQ